MIVLHVYDRGRHWRSRYICAMSGYGRDSLFAAGSLEQIRDRTRRALVDRKDPAHLLRCRNGQLAGELLGPVFVTIDTRNLPEMDRADRLITVAMNRINADNPVPNRVPSQTDRILGTVESSLPARIGPPSSAKQTQVVHTGAETRSNHVNPVNPV